MKTYNNKTLTNQEKFMKDHKKHHHQIAFYRILIFMINNKREKDRKCLINDKFLSFFNLTHTGTYD